MVRKALKMTANAVGRPLVLVQQQIDRRHTEKTDADNRVDVKERHIHPTQIVGSHQEVLVDQQSRDQDDPTKVYPAQVERGAAKEVRKGKAG